MSTRSLTPKQSELLEDLVFLAKKTEQTKVAVAVSKKRRHERKLTTFDTTTRTESTTESTSTTRANLTLEGPPVCIQLFIANTPLQNGLTGSTKLWVEHRLKKEGVVTLELASDYYSHEKASAPPKPVPSHNADIGSFFTKTPNSSHYYSYYNKRKTSRRSRADKGGVLTLPPEVARRSNIMNAKSA